MKFQKGNIYHIYNQGNNRQKIFLCDEDYAIFLRMINKYILPHTEIVAWCLMPNHFHLMVNANEKTVVMVKQGGLEIETLTNGIRKLLSGYARIFNKKYQKTGSLFRQKTKAKNLLDAEPVLNKSFSFSDYCCSCFGYIHQNPVSAGLVRLPEEWPWSSYLDYAGMRNGKLVNKALAEKYCGYDSSHFGSRIKGKLDEYISKDFD